MSIPDGRIAAWTSAWHCIETAQKTRAEAAKLPRNHDNLDVQRVYSQVYEQWMDEARAYIALTGVDLDVGIGAGAWLEERFREAQEQRERFDREAFADIFEHRKRNNCADCDTKLTPENRHVVDSVFVCPEHYDQRTKGQTDA